MKSISIKNIGITFNGRDLKADFRGIIDIPQPPTPFITNNTIESLPDGSFRQINTVNPSTDLTIQFAGELVEENTKEAYTKMVYDELIDVLTIFSLDDGKILGTWRAVVKDVLFLGAIANGAGNNGSITFNLVGI